MPFPTITSVAGRDTVILAHQGGWDEIMAVVGPALIIVVLVMLGRKREQMDEYDDDYDDEYDDDEPETPGCDQPRS